MTASGPGGIGSAAADDADRACTATLEHPVDGTPSSHRSAWPSWAMATTIAVSVVGASVLTVLRSTAPFLQADTILQSVMSVQDVRLFYWGQDRFASVVPLLASPIADPMTNLFLCLLINALAFHVLLLILARMGTVAVAGNRKWSSTLVLFLLMTAVAHTVPVAKTLFTIALDAQPYSMSWALALGAFVLWKMRRRWSLALAAAMIGVAVGLNPSVALLGAFLSLIELIRSRRWVAWISFGVIWLVWLVIWVKLSSWFPGLPGPTPRKQRDYLSFNFHTFGIGAAKSVGTIYASLDPAMLMVLVVVACVSTLLLSPERRAILLPRLALAILFSTLFWTVFAGNPWVAANGFHFRYFFPVILALVVAIAAPIAGALLTVRLPSSAASANKRLALATATLAVAASFVGPLTPPSQSTTILATKPTADYARANDVTFVAGYYWLLWPVLLQMLDDGRTAAFGTGNRTDGDPAAYRTAFDNAMKNPDSPPRAICVGEDVSVCRTYLNYWTRPGWREVPGNCPVPSLPSGLFPAPHHTCTILEFPIR